MAAKAYKEQLNNNLATRNDLEAVKTELGYETDLIKKDTEHIKHQLNTNFATKADLAEVKGEIDLVKKDVEHIKEQMATKLDIEKLFSRMEKMGAILESKMDKMNASLESRMDKIDARIDKTDNNYGWVKTLNIAIITALLGLILTSPSVQHFFHGIFV